MTRDRWFTSALVIAIGALPLDAAADERLVYLHEQDDGKRAIVMADGDGGHPRTVAQGTYPVVSADGDTIAYIDARDSGKVLVTHHLPTGHIEQWTADAGFYLQPDISANGRFLAVSGPYGPEVAGERFKRRNLIAVFDMWRLRSGTGVAGRGRTLYTGAPEVIVTEFAAYFPELSSDGRFVVFHQSHGRGATGKGARNKWITRYDREPSRARRGGARVRDLTSPDEYCFSPAISQDDEHVAFICRVTFDGVANDDIYITDADGRAARTRVTRDPGKDWAPTFRADGSVVFASDRAGHLQLYRATRTDDTADHRVEPLVMGPGSHYVPSYSAATAD